MLNNAEDSLKKLIQENRRDLNTEGGYVRQSYFFLVSVSYVVHEVFPIICAKSLF